MKTSHDKKPIEFVIGFHIDYGIPNDDDPDDALEARCLREHDGAPALELLHPEQDAHACLMSAGHWLYVGLADEYFAYQLDFIKRRYNDATPY